MDAGQKISPDDLDDGIDSNNLASKTLNLEQGTCLIRLFVKPQQQQEQQEPPPPSASSQERGGEEELPSTTGGQDQEQEVLAPPSLDSAVLLEVDVSMTETRYPFQGPVVRVIHGAEKLPPQLVRYHDQVLLLPQLEEGWTPKMGLLDVLTTVTNVIKNSSGSDNSSSSKAGGPLYVPEQELNLDDLLVPAAANTSTSSSNSTSSSSSSSFLFPCSVTQQNGAILHRYLGLTDDWLLNLRAHETKMNHAVVCKAKELLQIHKLKYRREESISLVFRDGERWNFEMADSYECVTAIKDKMNAKGVRGHKTNQASLNQLAKVQALIKQAQQIEATLQAAPTLQRVQMIMDLYREATERLSSVSNDKQKTSDLTALLHTFLLRPDVQDILEGKKQPPPPPSSTRSALPAIPSFSKIGQMVHQLQMKGQVLPRSESLVNSDEDDGLAREEKNLVRKGISQLQKMMDLNLGEPAGAAATGSGGAGGGGGAGVGEREKERERDTQRGRTESSASDDMSSASSSSSSRTRTNTGTGSATDKALAELEVFLGDANRELENLQQSTTTRAAAAAAAATATTTTAPTHQEEEEEIVI